MPSSRSDSSAVQLGGLLPVRRSGAPLVTFSPAPVLPPMRENTESVVWPSGLELYDEFVSVPQENEILEAVDSEEWDTRSLGRRVQQYGIPYDYVRRELSTAARPVPMPRWLSDVSEAVSSALGHPAGFDQAIVNEYMPGQGIGPHSDHPSFGPVVASVSLGSGVDMEFWSRRGDVCVVRLPPRTLTSMSSPARYEWRHGIVPRKSDPVRRVSVPRSRRVSITLRTVSA